MSFPLQMEILLHPDPNTVAQLPPPTTHHGGAERENIRTMRSSDREERRWTETTWRTQTWQNQLHLPLNYNPSYSILDPETHPFCREGWESSAVLPEQTARAIPHTACVLWARETPWTRTAMARIRYHGLHSAAHVQPD